MAAHDLTVLSHPNFPQVLDAAIDHALGRMVERVLARHMPELGCCQYESPESYGGACDSEPCRALATVHHLASEQEFCLAHFLEVSRG